MWESKFNALILIELYLVGSFQNDNYFIFIQSMTTDFMQFYMYVCMFSNFNSFASRITKIWIFHRLKSR